MTELWKPIINYEGRYEVSSYGRVRSIDRKDSRGRSWKGKVLRPRMRRGYYAVVLYCKGCSNTLSIHRLVAEAFLPNSLDKPVVNHKDGVKTNNTLANLEWVSASENVKHAITTGLNPIRVGKDAANFKGAVEVLDKNNQVVDILNGSEDMRDKGFNPSHICNVINGKRNTHKGYYFKRKEEK